MKRADIELETLTCPSCLQKIENAMKGLAGIDQESVKVRFNASKVRLNFDEDAIAIEDIEQAIRTLGYEVKKSRVRAA